MTGERQPFVVGVVVKSCGRRLVDVVVMVGVLEFLHCRVQVLKVQELGETRWPEHKKPQTLASDGVTEVGPKTETPILTKVGLAKVVPEPPFSRERATHGSVQKLKALMMPSRNS